MSKSAIVKDEHENIICFFSSVKDVTLIASDLYFKVTLVDGKYFIFDASKYKVDIVSGKKVKIVNEL